MILLLSRAPLLPLCVNGCVYRQTFQKILSLNSWSTGKDICRCEIGWCKLTALKGMAGNVFSHQGLRLWSRFPWVEWTRWNKSLFISQDTVMCSMSYPVPVRMAVLCAALQGAPKEREKEREGLACLGCEHTECCLHTDSGSPSLCLSLCFLCQRHPSNWLVSMQYQRRGF